MSETTIVCAIYVLLAEVDRWWQKRMRRKELEEMWDDELSNWEQDPQNPEFEDKGNLSRKRLTGLESYSIRQNRWVPDSDS